MICGKVTGVSGLSGSETLLYPLAFPQPNTSNRCIELHHVNGFTRIDVDRLATYMGGSLPTAAMGGMRPRNSLY